MVSPKSHFDNASSPFEIRQLADRGKGIVALRCLSGDEEVFEEPALIIDDLLKYEYVMSVKTYMILGGVIVLRRSKVEVLYEKLAPLQQSQYRSLHPLCESTPSTPSADTSENCLRRRDGKEERVDNGTDSQPDVLPLTSEQHRQIWDCNGFHYCDASDVRVNRLLHVYMLPCLLSLVTGYAHAWWFETNYTRSILGAAVLFFLMLGPLTTRLFYLGSQAIFLQASLVNHSCSPNAKWRINVQIAPLGELGRLAPVESAAEGLPKSDADVPIKLSLRALCDVKQSEELTIDYIPDLAHIGAAERRNLLNQEFGFLCSCRKCLASEKKSSSCPVVEVESEEEESH